MRKSKEMEGKERKERKGEVRRKSGIGRRLVYSSTEDGGNVVRNISRVVKSI